MSKIGVFDSGIGGKAIADTLQVDFPDVTVMYVDDKKNVPYGSRTLDEIFGLTDRAIQPLLDARCNIIVLACNTATAAAIERLREKYPSTLFVGLEPMVKLASEMTKSGVVAICATPFTLSSERYKSLKRKYATNIRVIEPDCSDWAYLIEHNQIDSDKIATIINEVCESGADTIVLACTHYHWIKEEIIAVAGNRAIVIDPSEAISRRVAQLLY